MTDGREAVGNMLQSAVIGADSDLESTKRDESSLGYLPTEGSTARATDPYLPVFESIADHRPIAIFPHN